MGPEQVRGEDVDGRTDLYAVGVVFYRLLTGELPFKAETADDELPPGAAIVMPSPNGVLPGWRGGRGRAGGAGAFDPGDATPPGPGRTAASN